MLSVWSQDRESETYSGVLQTDERVSEAESPLRLSLSNERYEQESSISQSVKRLNVGFTGTRRGMTDEQAQRVMTLLQRLANSYPNHELWGHHGDCIESDEQFHDIAKKCGYKIHIHPPVNKKLRAFRKGDATELPKAYKIRNQDIVRESVILIATPHRMEKDGSQIYSGTWATVRIARRRNKPYVVFYSDGRREGGNKWRRVLKR